MTRVRFDLESLENGRLVMRTCYLDVAPGSQGRRLRMSVEGFVFLSVPLSPWESLAGDDDEDDDE